MDHRVGPSKSSPKPQPSTRSCPSPSRPTPIDSDFIQLKNHKDQANDKDYSHEGLGFSFKKWQADTVM